MDDFWDATPREIGQLTTAYFEFKLGKSHQKKGKPMGTKYVQYDTIADMQRDYGGAMIG